MPRNGFPATMGLYPITGADVARSAARMPPIFRMEPMLTTGFDGAINTTSAPSIASVTPGAAVALSAPTNAKLSVGTWARYRTHHSWKWTAFFSPSAGSVMTTWVSLRSSLAGSRRAPGFHRAHSASVIWERG